MGSDFPLFPEQASTMASQVDYLYFFLVAVTVFFSVLIFATVFIFAIRYRRRSESELPRPIVGSLRLELLWTIIPLLITMVMFVWGADVYFNLYTPPQEGMNVYVVAKQWMWKLQHPEGKREINELHIPTGVPVRLTMTSEDVIHSFYVPAFRTKMDVVPGRYTSVWFEATKPGRYHLFCAEYCGTSHSSMGGWIHVMEPSAYENWLSGGTPGAESMAVAGERLFARHGCVTCHRSDSGARGPDLHGLFGSTVQLIGGGTILADDAYLRESILDPTARIVDGYAPIMPTFRGQIGEEDVMRLIAYIKSLSAAAPPASIPGPEVEPAAGIENQAEGDQ